MSGAQVRFALGLLADKAPAHARVEEVDVLREPYRGDLPPFTVRG